MKNFFVWLGLVATLFAGQCRAAEGYACTDETLCCQECCDEQGTCEFGIDWLYWKSSQDGLEIAGEVQVGLDTELELNARILRPKFKLDSGVRLIGSYQPCDETWKVSGIFTHMPSSARVSVNNDPNALDSFTLYNFLGFPLLTGVNLGVLSSPTAHWNLEVNYFDIDISRTFCACECFQFRPHLGFRGFWMNQKVTINGSAPLISFQTVMRQKVQGYGLEGGIDAAWKLNCGFSIVAHVGGAVLYSRFRGTGTANDTLRVSPLIDLEVAVVNYKDRVYKSTPMIDTFLGLQYVKNWCERVVSMRLGWEQHILFEANQFALVGTGGNLTMQGLTLGGGLTF